MLRGFRWQLLLVGLAIILLGVVIILTAPQPDSQPAPGQEAATLAAQPTTPPAQVMAPTPLPPDANPDLAAFREGLVGELHRLNPLFSSMNPVDRDISSLIFEGLVTADQYGEYLPALADSWTITADGMEYVFRLRQDVLWQDGVPFTAADVAATVALLQAPGDILPADLTTFWRTVELELLDEYTVRFRLAQPLAAFLDYMRIGLLPAHVFNNIPVEQLPAHPFNLSPIGTGPYQLEHISGDENGVSSISLRVAPVYRQRQEGQSGYLLERMIFRMYASEDDALSALQAGEIDGLGGVQDRDLTPLEQAGDIAIHISTAPTVGVLLMNWESEHTLAFRNYRVRQALAQGIDRAGLVNRHLAGRAILADSPIIPGSWAYAGPVRWPEYDPAQAMADLAEVDFAMPQPEVTATPEGESTDGTPVPTVTPVPAPTSDFELLSSDAPAQAAMAAEIAGQWAQVGITVQVESVPQTVLDERLDSGDFDVALVEETYSPRVDPDPFAFWHQGQYPDGQNYAGINDRSSSELLERARRDPNGLHRTQYYTEFQQIFVTRVLAIPLYYPVYAYAVSSAVEGVQLGYLSTPADRFFTLQNWRVTGG